MYASSYLVSVIRNLIWNRSWSLSKSKRDSWRYICLLWRFSLAYKPTRYPSALYTWRDELDFLRAKLRYTQVSHPVVVRSRYIVLREKQKRIAPRFRFGIDRLGLALYSRYYRRFRLCTGVCDATASACERKLASIRARVSTVACIKDGRLNGIHVSMGLYTTHSLCISNQYCNRNELTMVFVHLDELLNNISLLYTNCNNSALCFYKY